MTEKIELTENERRMLVAIRDSEYHSSAGEDRVDEAIWSDTTMDTAEGFGMPRPTHGGICASLKKKGLAMFQQDCDGEVIWITRAGYDAIQDIPTHSPFGPWEAR